MMTIACHGVQNSLQMPNISYFIDFRDTFHVCLELELEVYNCLVIFHDFSWDEQFVQYRKRETY